MDGSYVGLLMALPSISMGMVLLLPATLRMTGSNLPVTGSGAIVICPFPVVEMLLMLYTPGFRVTVLVPARMLSPLLPGARAAVLLTLVVAGVGIVGVAEVTARGNWASP